MPPRWHLIYAELLVVVLILVHQAQTQIGEEQNFSALYSRNLRQLVRLVDEDVEPCEDFFRHACGYYEHIFAYGGESTNTMSHFGETESDELEDEDEEVPRVPPMLYNVEDRMHFFDENYQRFDSAAGRLLSHLYTECRALKSVEEPTRSTQTPPADRAMELQWRRMLQQIPFIARDIELFRQWPYLHFQWRELNKHWDLNWATLAAEFAAHGVDTFLRIFFAEGTIYIAPVDDVRCGEFDEVRETIQKLMSEGRNPQIADVIAGELVEFCREINGKIKRNGGARDGEARDEGARNGETLDGGSHRNSSDDVLLDERSTEYLQLFFAHLNFTEAEVHDARKLLVDARRIAHTLTTFHRSEPRIVYNYVVWRVHASLRRSTDCYLLTEEFEDLLLAEYWQWHVFAPHFGRDVALATFLYHTTRFQQRRKAVLMGDAWDAFLETRPQRRDFNVPRMLRTYANSVLQPDRLVSTTYSPLTWQRNVFFANLLAMRRLRLRAAFTQPQRVDFARNNDDDDDDYDHLNHPHYFLRQFLDFAIVILKQPLFHYFATQGLELWRASGLLHSSDGFYTALDCLEQQRVRHEDESPIYGRRTLGYDEVEEIFRLHRAFAAAQRDYRFWLEGEFFAFAEDLVLDQYGLDSRRILFYAVAQQHCGRNDGLHGGRVNRVFMNTPSFQEAFNCSPDAPMNPVVKCMTERCEER